MYTILRRGQNGTGAFGASTLPSPRTARLAERAHNTVVISAGVVAQELVEYRQRIFGAFE
jgi:hypothetical protein